MAHSKAEASAIRTIMQGAGWEVIVKLHGEKIEKLRAEKVTGTNEFETLRALHIREGKVEALTEFFEELENLASN